MLGNITHHPSLHLQPMRAQLQVPVGPRTLKCSGRSQGMVQQRLCESPAASRVPGVLVQLGCSQWTPKLICASLLYIYINIQGK